MPLRTDRATTQKDMLAYARLLVVVKLDQVFPEVISFKDEKGHMQTQKVVYECKPIICADCHGIGHTKEQCRQKRYEVAQRKIIPRNVWVSKKGLRPSSEAGLAKVTTTVDILPNIDENKEGEEEVIQEHGPVQNQVGKEGPRGGNQELIRILESSQENERAVEKGGETVNKDGGGNDELIPNGHHSILECERAE